MSPAVLRLIRVPVTVACVWLILAVVVPIAMSAYQPYVVRPGISCVRTSVPLAQGAPLPAEMCESLAAHYHLPFLELLVDSTLRSFALLAGAGVVALVVGSLLGTSAALLRRRTAGAGAIVALTTVLAAVPAFFVAYFLQIAVVLLGPGAGRDSIVPVFGFGYDSHLVLPLLSISLAPVAYTAQLTATRMQEVLESDFVTAATAKGLPQSWILRTHVLPHVRPVLIEALGSGLRISVASLPIIEYLFVWRGIGQLALEAIGVHDAPALIFSGVALALVFTTLSAVADLSRPRGLYADS
jgi:peptide/nickel transport system permease protein